MKILKGSHLLVSSKPIRKIAVKQLMNRVIGTVGKKVSILSNNNGFFFFQASLVSALRLAV